MQNRNLKHKTFVVILFIILLIVGIVLIKKDYENKERISNEIIQDQLQRANAINVLNN